MRTGKTRLALTFAACLAVAATAHAQAPPPRTGRASVAWTIGGAGAGFGVGLWAGLTIFDDAIDSERKVWTSALIGAAAGAVGGYLIGKSRARAVSPSPDRAGVGFSSDKVRASYGCDRIVFRRTSLRQRGRLSALGAELGSVYPGDTGCWYSRVGFSRWSRGTP